MKLLSKEKEKNILNYLRRQVTGTRLSHILGVKENVEKLARTHKMSLGKAVLAAYLHDSAKLWTLQKLQNVLAGKRKEIGELGFSHHGILHAYGGAFVAKQVFGIREKDVLEAISFHPTGKPRMGKLAKLLYVADYCEKGRGLEDLGRILSLAMKSLDDACRLIALRKLSWVLKKEGRLHPLTLEFLGFLD